MLFIILGFSASIMNIWIGEKSLDDAWTCWFAVDAVSRPNTKPTICTLSGHGTLDNCCCVGRFGEYTPWYLHCTAPAQMGFRGLDLRLGQLNAHKMFYARWGCFMRVEIKWIHCFKLMRRLSNELLRKIYNGIHVAWTHSNVKYSRYSMQQTDHDRERKFQIQLSMQVSDSCSEDTLHKSLKKKLVSSFFSNTPLFQVNTQGLGTQMWILDAKLDNGALSTTSALSKKFRLPVQQAFEECLSPP